MSGICSLSDRQSGPIDRTPVTPGSDNNRNILKKYEVNYMNLEQGAATSNKEPEKAWPSLHVTENKKDEERRSNFSERCQRESSNERLIEYCEEEDEECNEAVSGKLAIHLNTGETSREFCINRVDDAHSRRSQTREESVTCGSELEKPLFIKKYQGRFFRRTLRHPRTGRARTTRLRRCLRRGARARSRAWWWSGARKQTDVAVRALSATSFMTVSPLTSLIK